MRMSDKKKTHIIRKQTDDHFKLKFFKLIIFWLPFFLIITIIGFKEEYVIVLIVLTNLMPSVLLNTEIVLGLE